MGKTPSAIYKLIVPVDRWIDMHYVCRAIFSNINIRRGDSPIRWLGIGNKECSRAECSRLMDAQIGQVDK